MDIVWSKPALASLQQVLDYTYENFGARQVSIIAEKIDKTIERLSIFPNSSPLIYGHRCSDEQKLGTAPSLPFELSDRELRAAVVIKPLKLLYEIEGNTLKIHFIWDVRMNVSTVLQRISESLT